MLNKFIRYLRNFCYQTGIIIVKVYGGVPLDGQIQALNEGCNILIATPRRLDYLKKEDQFKNDIYINYRLNKGFSEQLKQ